MKMKQRGPRKHGTVHKSFKYTGLKSLESLAAVLFTHQLYHVDMASRERRPWTLAEDELLRAAVLEGMIFSVKAPN